MIERQYYFTTDREPLAAYSLRAAPQDDRWEEERVEIDREIHAAETHMGYPAVTERP